MEWTSKILLSINWKMTPKFIICTFHINMSSEQSHCLLR